MPPFECYKIYLSLKRHFTDKKYDYFIYNKKTRTSLKSFYKRTDRFYFEKLSRQKNDKEIEDFFVSNFVSSDSQSLWIGEIIKNGEENYTNWKKKIQSLSYLFKTESKNLLENYSLNELFDCSKSHPLILKKYLSNQISLETLVILDRIFHFSVNFDKKLIDPIWETIGLKIKKYSPFLAIDIFNYKKILKQIALGEK